MPILRSPFFGPQNRSGIEWITLLFSLAVLGVYIAWSLINDRSGVEAREQDRLYTQGRVIDKHIAQQLSAIRRVLINIREELPIWERQPGGMEIANQQLRSFIEALTGVRTLGILDASGKVIASNHQEFISQNFSGRDYFKNAKAHPDSSILHISPPFSAANGQWLMALSMTIPSENGGFDGVVAGALDPEHFSTTLGSVHYTEDMWSAIAHEDGLQFMMVPDRPGQAGMNLAQPGSFFTRHIKSGKRRNIMSGKVYSTGEYRMMALRTIQPPELLMDKALIMAVGRDLSSVYARWQKDAVFRGGLFLLLALTTSIALLAVQRIQRAREGDAASAAAAIQQKNAELETLNEQLRSLALVDGLTGIANRRCFDDIFQNEWRRCRRDHVPLSLLLIDIDHFKEFNDHYGHPAGDECLKKIAQTLKQQFGRSSDLVARYGGEEFVCLMPETDQTGAMAKAESLRAAIEGLNILHEHSEAARHVTISIGVSGRIPDEKDKPGSLIADADEALYCAKHQGRNQVYSRTSQT